MTSDVGGNHLPESLSGNCAETDPEQSSRALRPVCWHGETWRREQTTVYYDCKQSVPHLFLCSCTCLILGLGPQTKPPSMTTHHGLVTSHWDLWMITLPRTPPSQSHKVTPRHPIAMASTAKPPDPMPCALASALLQGPERLVFGPCIRSV